MLTVGSVVGWGTDSAMTIGWGWGRTACGRGNNHILANKIANSNLARCCDGGQVILSPPNCRPQKRMAVASVAVPMVS